MILESGGDLFELDLSDLSVALKLQLKNEKTSASTSATDTINTGTKAKQLSITGILAFTEAEHLNEIIKIAESIDSNGARTVYNINDDTASAADIRQVIFDGDFNVRKMKELNAWIITFTLLQKNSIAELKEQRAKSGDTPVSDTATGKVISNDDTETSIKDTNGMIYRYLKKLDDFLAPNED